MPTEAPGVGTTHGSSGSVPASVQDNLVSPSASFPTSATFEIAGPDGLRFKSWHDPYSLALDYINGRIQVHGDLVQAVRFAFRRTSETWRGKFLNAIVKGLPQRLVSAAGTLRNRTETAENIRFHYDRSNDFYQAFLDSRMVYSCAYFQRPDMTLDDAQLAKLDLVCRKLRLAENERFLDIGCGWGALILQAAQNYGAQARGCTLSHRQAEFVNSRIQRDGLVGQVTIEEIDYRDTTGKFDKIASVGMFEHVGSKQLRNYFKKIYQMLAPGGLFLNHGITRPAPIHSDAGSMFITRKVFPGGQILRLEDVVRAAELAGLEVLDVENLRRHYALTCRQWVNRLSENRQACLRTVDVTTWRTWKLYLAGSAVAFEDGDLGLHQVLFTRRGSREAPFTREEIYQT